MKMRIRIISAALVLGLLVCSNAQAEITLNFSSLGNTDPTKEGIQFNGSTDTFVFNHGSDNPFTTPDESNFAFSVTGSSTGRTGSNSAVFSLGDITGVYTIGSITPSGPKEVADVTGTGTFSITDASGNAFAADVSWIRIQTEGTGGTINAGGQLNLTNATYSGLNQDLQQLLTEVNALGGIATITFQFASAKTLTQLTTEDQNNTSYSGSVTTAVPVPPTLVMLGVGGAFAGVASLLRRRKGCRLTIGSL